MDMRPLLVFFSSLAFLAVTSSWAFRHAVGSSVPLLDQDLPLQQHLPASWVDRDVIRASKVRRQREFWAFEKSSVTGAALRVLEVPELRSALFPGYPESMFADDDLWRAYSSRDFSSTAWL